MLRNLYFSIILSNCLEFVFQAACLSSFKLKSQRSALSKVFFPEAKWNTFGKSTLFINCSVSFKVYFFQVNLNNRSLTTKHRTVESCTVFRKIRWTNACRSRSEVVNLSITFYGLNFGFTESHFHWLNLIIIAWWAI